MSETARRWHVYPWPASAWLETMVKSAALVVGMDSFVQGKTSDRSKRPAKRRLGEAGVLGLLSLGLLAAVVDRWKDREVVSMIFVLFNNLGHWGMLAALVWRGRGGQSIRGFAGLMLAGDLVKLWFVQRHQFGVRQYSPRVVLGLTGAYVLGYAGILATSLAQD